ncbi:MAG: hypothetical protein NW226_21380 [Microscillaceae bacterium]|nr:hypothetical protein [Microscillaceae bacterium]
MELSLTIRNLYRAIGELAFVMTRSDKVTSKIEKIVFKEAIKEDLGKESWLAEDRFNWLDLQGEKIDVEATYNRVIFMIRQNKQGLSEELIEKFISVLEKVAGVKGITDDEIALIERFREDVTKIHQEN